MSKYEKYISSGIDFLGDIPNHWKRKRIKDVSDTIAGGTPDTGKEAYWEGDIPWLPSGKVQNCIINKEDADTFITELGLKNSATKMLPYPSVLVALTGATCSNIGYLTFDACANQSVVGMPGSKQLHPSYLYHTLQSQKEQILLHQTGGAQGGISERNVKFLFIPLPPPAEQLTIANYLDDQTQKIDRLIANKKVQVDKLKELRQIEINKAVTKGLNPNAEMKDSGIDWLGKIPKHWEVKRLKNVSNFIQTGITPPSEKSEYYDGDIPWYGPGGFSGDTILSNPAKYITQKAIDDNEAKLFPIDCIFMIGIGATIGKVGIIKEPSSCNQQLNIVNFKNYVSPDFGVYLLKTYENIIIKIANFSTLPIYNQVQTGNLKFLLPPKEEQLQIAKYLQERTAAIDKLIINIDAQIEKLQELRKIKIYEAVTGKIKVNAYVETTA